MEVVCPARWAHPPGGRHPVDGGGLSGRRLRWVVPGPHPLPGFASVAGVRWQGVGVNVEGTQQVAHLGVSKLIPLLRKDLPRHDGGAVADSALLGDAEAHVRQRRRPPLLGGAAAEVKEGGKGGVQHLHATGVVYHPGLRMVHLVLLLSIDLFELAKLRGAAVLLSLHESRHVSLYRTGWRRKAGDGHVSMAAMGDVRDGGADAWRWPVEPILWQERWELMELLLGFGCAEEVVHEGRQRIGGPGTVVGRAGVAATHKVTHRGHGTLCSLPRRRPGGRRQGRRAGQIRKSW
mmetsp:Transcript_19336/g.53888  ORF Transcript_19336/g.53888 Transcript_19336/m.53888 type:complete len:291 (+) Transcript_19336:1827-2699(+)